MSDAEPKQTSEVAAVAFEDFDDDFSLFDVSTTLRGIANSAYCTSKNFAFLKTSRWLRTAVWCEQLFDDLGWHHGMPHIYEVLYEVVESIDLLMRKGDEYSSAELETCMLAALLHEYNDSKFPRRDFSLAEMLRFYGYSDWMSNDVVGMIEKISFSKCLLERTSGLLNVVKSADMILAIRRGGEARLVSYSASVDNRSWDNIDQPMLEVSELLSSVSSEEGRSKLSYGYGMNWSVRTVIGLRLIPTCLDLVKYGCERYKGEADELLVRWLELYRMDISELSRELRRTYSFYCDDPLPRALCVISPGVFENSDELVHLIKITCDSRRGFVDVNETSSRNYSVRIMCGSIVKSEFIIAMSSFGDSEAKIRITRHDHHSTRKVIVLPGTILTAIDESLSSRQIMTPLRRMQCDTYARAAFDYVAGFVKSRVKGSQFKVKCMNLCVSGIWTVECSLCDKQAFEVSFDYLTSRAMVTFGFGMNRDEDCLSATIAEAVTAVDVAMYRSGILSRVSRACTEQARKLSQYELMAALATLEDEEFSIAEDDSGYFTSACIKSHVPDSLSPIYVYGSFPEIGQEADFSIWIGPSRAYESASSLRDLKVLIGRLMSTIKNGKQPEKIPASDSEAVLRIRHPDEPIMVQEEWFDCILSKGKTVEGRTGPLVKWINLKHQLVRFECENTGQSLPAYVLDVRHYLTLVEYLTAEGYANAIPTARDLTQAVRAYEGISSGDVWPFSKRSLTERGGICAIKFYLV